MSATGESDWLYFNSCVLARASRNKGRSGCFDWNPDVRREWKVDALHELWLKQVVLSGHVETNRLLQRVKILRESCASR